MELAKNVSKNTARLWFGYSYYKGLCKWQFNSFNNFVRKNWSRFIEFDIEVIQLNEKNLINIARYWSKNLINITPKKQ
jgi:hypothetical protein